MNTRKNIELISKRFVFGILLILFILLSPVSASKGNNPNRDKTINFTEIHVATNGDINNSGTYNEPFATLQSAIEKSRDANIRKPVKIIIHKGDYFDTKIELAAIDSNLTITAAKGEQPVLYGGKRLSNWNQDGKFISVKLPSVCDRIWDFRSLIVNGKSRFRARLPESGGFTHESVFDVKWMSTTAGGWQRNPTEKELTTMIYKKGDLGSWLDLKNAELCLYHSWDESVVGLSANDTINRILTFSTQAFYPAGSFSNIKKAHTYVVWNIVQGMTNPGQWYLDRSEGKLVYWLLPDEDINTIDVIAPTTESVFVISDNTSNITLSGLTIRCTTTSLMSPGFGAGFLSAAIDSKGNKCKFENLTIEQVGGWAIKVEGAKNSIRYCNIRNTGAGAIKFNGDDGIVTDNIINKTGEIYPSSIALFGNGARTTVAHNEMNCSPYSAIGFTGHYALIENNLITDAMQVMNDGAAIYLGGSKNSLIKGNVVIGSGGINGRREEGYYFDENSFECILEGNYAFNTTYPLHNHMNSKCIIRNNLFIDERSSSLTFHRASDMVFEKNIVIADTIDLSIPTGKLEPDLPEKLIKYANATGLSSMSDNIFYSRSGKVVHNSIIGYQKISCSQLTPANGNVLADPFVEETGKYQFSFKSGSPAIKAGIKLLNLSGVGPRKRTD